MVGPGAMRVLIVDDVPDIRQTMQFQLERRGYVVQLASTGREAIELLTQSAKEPYRVAIIDVKLPDGSGVEVLKAIKRLSPETTCLMMTAYPMPNGQADATLNGATDYFVKPFTVQQLLDFMNHGGN